MINKNKTRTVMLEAVSTQKLVGKRIEFLRRPKNDKSATFTVYCHIDLGNVPRAEEYTENLDEETERRNQMSDLYEYSWKVVPIYKMNSHVRRKRHLQKSRRL